ncbi:hypothetical protein [Enterococcus pallens]|nr:hypothetical protein [Enterococcus pallens]OJG69735.1 hypothetical protein RV10_GL000735 [Enterococcus pallens]
MRTEIEIQKENVTLGGTAMSKKEGFVADNVRFVSKHIGGEDVLYFEAKKEVVCIQTVREPENTQHDIVMTKDEWEVLKRLIDIQLVH